MATRRAAAQPDEQVRRIDRSLSELMRLTTSQRVHEARARASGVHLSRTAYRVLATVEDSGRISVSHLAHRLDVSQPTASRSLQQLESEGLVRRGRDRRDRRVVVYEPTAQGRSARRRLREHMRRSLAGALADLPAARRTALADLLDELVRRLYAAGPPAGTAG